MFFNSIVVSLANRLIHSEKNTEKKNTAAAGRTQGRSLIKRKFSFLDNS